MEVWGGAIFQLAPLWSEQIRTDVQKEGQQSQERNKDSKPIGTREAKSIAAKVVSRTYQILLIKEDRKRVVSG